MLRARERSVSSLCRGTPEFVAEYQEAISGAVTPLAKRLVEIERGTFRHLTVQYLKCTAYGVLDISTRKWKRRTLERVCESYGDNVVSQMQARHVRKLRDELASTPAAANQRIKALRALFNWANEAGETAVNPTLGVKRLKYASDGHHTWSEDESHSIRLDIRSIHKLVWL